MQIRNCIKRINRFYGDVAIQQNREIINLVTGKSLLDIGCGYGLFLNQIKNERAHIKAMGIDVDEESLKIARNTLNVDARLGSVYHIEASDNSFDTVILRETIHHLNENGKLDIALQEIHRVCIKELIIFDPNPTWLLRISRRLISHKDPEIQPNKALEYLKINGFEIKNYLFRDTIAFPLSGGFVGLELVPNQEAIKKIIINFDMYLNRFFKKFKVQKYFCWRYLIYARKR